MTGPGLLPCGVMGGPPMNQFLIGQKLRIHHYSDWSGSAFLDFAEEAFRIPGEAARLIVFALRRAQTQGPDLEEHTMTCARCGGAAGTAWLPVADKRAVRAALCRDCADAL